MASVLLPQLTWVAVLRGCVALVHEMEACNEHSSVHFKQCAITEFFTPTEIH
jgi:hypothetical protein